MVTISIASQRQKEMNTYVYVVEHHKHHPNCEHSDVTIMHVASSLALATAWTRQSLSSYQYPPRDLKKPWWLQIVQEEVDGNGQQIVIMVDWNGQFAKSEKPDYVTKRKVTLKLRAMRWLNKAVG